VRRFLGLAGVILIAGCVTAAGQSGAPVTVAAAPPIVALDEAPPGEVQSVLDLTLTAPDVTQSTSTSTQILTVTSSADSGTDTLGAGGTSTSAKATDAQVAALRAQIEAQHAATEPAADSPARTVASLPLDNGGTAFFTVWHNNAGLLCTETETLGAQGGGGGGGPDGPCLGSLPGGTDCGALCLGTSGGGDSQADTSWVLSGTVDASADAIDVSTADGATTEYPLTGPVVDGDRRVFLLDLGGQAWRTLVLLRNGRAVDRTDQPATIVALENCESMVGPAPAPSHGMDAWNTALQSCLSKSSSTP
jgi:hypothetical protein